MIELQEIFDIYYGNSLDLNKLEKNILPLMFKINTSHMLCFDITIISPIAKPSFFIGFLMWFMCFKNNDTIGLLNPPYAQSKSDAELHELYFVKEMLDLLDKGGLGVAIIPVSCVISIEHKGDLTSLYSDVLHHETDLAP
jgi:hypothetical protein